MAYGIIQPNKQKSVEEMGKTHFDELFTKSFSQKLPSTSGKYAIPGPLHELEQYLSHGELYTADRTGCGLSDNEPVLKRVRHLYIHENELSLVM